MLRGVESGRRVVFILFDGMKMLDVMGPAEVFAEAGLVGADYTISYVSPSGQPVMTSAGIRLPVDGTPDDVTDADMVVVSGGDVLVTHPVPEDLVAAIQKLRGRTRRLVSICTGSFALARGCRREWISRSRWSSRTTGRTSRGRSRAGW